MKLPLSARTKPLILYRNIFYKMQNKEAYDKWSSTYDLVANQTRDLEANVFRSLLSKINFSTALELGCGTGKNTEWLAEKADQVIAVDFSDEMVHVARKKISKNHVRFVVADITRPWIFTDKKVDLVTCSLILEHIENIDFIFQQASLHLEDQGIFYVGELHPFKQYGGSKARFETGSGSFTLQCFTHHISEYMNAAFNNKFSCLSFNEAFDEEVVNTIPRIAAFIFQKNK